MEDFIKTDPNNSNKEFEALLTKDFAKRKIVKDGSIANATIIKIQDKIVVVEVEGGKSEGMIDKSEFALSGQEDLIKENSNIEVYIERGQDMHGNMSLSFTKAIKMKAWKDLESSFKAKKPILGILKSSVKGGYAIETQSVLMFCPKSQISASYIRRDEIEKLSKEKHKYSILSMDSARGNILVSRKVLEEEVLKVSRTEMLKSIKVGQIIEDAVVRGIQPYGIFFDIKPTLSALCHLTSISWSRVDNPGDVVQIGSKHRVKIVKIENDRVHCSIKDLFPDPYIEAAKKYEVGKVYSGVISRIESFGAFCTLDGTPNLEGLIFKDLISYKKGIAPNKILSTSQKVKVRLVSMDPVKRRISFDYRSVNFENPWDLIKKNYPVGTVFEGKVSSKSDYALYVEIPKLEILVFVHKNDISFQEHADQLKKWQKGDKVKGQIVEVSPDDGKLRGSIRILEKDPFDFYKGKKEGSSIVTLFVRDITENSIKVSTTNDDKGFLSIIKRSELGREKQDQRVGRFTKFQKVDCLITKLGDRNVSLSIKQAELVAHAEAVKKYGSGDSGGTLADVFGSVFKKKKKT